MKKCNNKKIDENITSGKKLHVKNDVQPDLAVHHFSLRQNGTWHYPVHEFGRAGIAAALHLLLPLLKRLHLHTETVLSQHDAAKTNKDLHFDRRGGAMRRSFLHNSAVRAVQY